MMRVAPHHSILVEGDVSLEGLRGLVSGTFSHLGLRRAHPVLGSVEKQWGKAPEITIVKFTKFAIRMAWPSEYR